jgi:hypothetical protein
VIELNVEVVWRRMFFFGFGENFLSVSEAGGLQCAFIKVFFLGLGSG